MTQPSISPETVLRTAREVLEMSLSTEEARSLAELLGRLAVEMEPMRRMATSDAEPATLFEARP